MGPKSRARSTDISYGLQLLSAEKIDKLLQDLTEVIADLKANPPKQDGDLVALYGIGATSVGPQVVSKVAEMFIDTLYMTRN